MSKIEEKILKLTPQRSVAIKQIQRVEDFMKANEKTATKEEICIRLQALDAAFQSFNTSQGQLELLDPKEYELNTREQTEELYYTLKPKLQSKLSKLTGVCAASSKSIESNFVKLPKCEITPFAGDRKQWITFNESFQKLVHNNTTLSDIAKFGYLKQLILSPASQTIASLELTTENYHEALKLLQDRFSNKKLICEDHIKELFALKPLNNPSAEQIRLLIDTVNSNLRALHTLQRPTEHWSDLLVYIICSKLDTDTKSKWNDTAPENRLASLEELLNFLNKRSHALEGHQQSSISSTKKYNHSNSHQKVSLTVSSSRKFSCQYCNLEGHRIFNCRKFYKLPTDQRISHVMQLKLCSNCLSDNHSSNECKSKYKCKVCSNSHHSLLHNSSGQSEIHKSQTFHITCTPEASSVTQSSHYSQSSPVDSKIHSKLASIHKYQSFTSASDIALKSQGFISNKSALHVSNLQSYVYLGTALIKVMNKRGHFLTARALLDSCSQSHFVTSEFAIKLGHKRRKSQSTIITVGNTSTQSNSKIDLKIYSNTTSFSTVIEAHILNQIVDNHPTLTLDTSNWKIPKNISLADATFAIPQKIDILIGAELYLSLLSIGQITLGPNLPRLQNTLLGWIVCGAASTQQGKSTSTLCNTANQGHETNLDSILQKFWDMETPSTEKSHFTNVELQCESHFKEHTYRNESGRFVVALPFLRSPNNLGNSKSAAIRRFFNLEKRFEREPNIKHSYQDFMNEYYNLHHMVLVPDEEIKHPHYYMPHHCVVKEESSTTKLRVVFDASAKTDTGVSLNSLLMVGPVIQSDLFSILLRFRGHRYGISADVTKMYRQFLVRDDETQFQYVLWRNNPNEKLQTYRLTTITYGTAAAPYLATKCLCSLAESYDARFPTSSQILHRDVYVDNLLTGGDTIDEVMLIKSQIIEMVSSAGMELRKWCSNSVEVLQDISECDREPFLMIEDDNVVKTLGLLWIPQEDNFRIHISQCNNNNVITKRSISSEIARIFDPLGFTGPVIIIGKLILKKLWELKIDWDAAIPQELYTTWQRFKSELINLNQLRIPRYAFSIDKCILVHGFADASEVAYGVAIYVSSETQSGSKYSHLICAKSRVAPSKVVTIPRLELCAAELLSKLMQHTAEIMKLSPSQLHYWTDSSIVLQWINSESSNFKTFVAARVSRIQRLSTISNWRHVPTKNNPADLISRGVFPSQLISSRLWFEGPHFLSEFTNDWPIQPRSEIIDATILERKISKVSLAVTSRDRTDQLLATVKYRNNYRSLVNVISFVVRFISNSKLKNTSDRSYSMCLTESERMEGLFTIIRLVQQNEFGEEYKLLLDKKLVPKRSQLRSLSVFIDEKNIIRVGGRLTHSSLPYASKFPIILPAKHSFTFTLLNYFHRKYLHAGPQALLAVTREKYWPINGRRVATRVCNSCITCIRVRPKAIVQTMGNLPMSRISTVPPFYHVGVDYCGPFFVHYKIRGKTPTKAYLCVFICFTVKAIHLELVTEMTTAAFLGALKRFVSTRGLCKRIWSDNGSNFVGANNQLNELYHLFKSEAHREEVQKMCQDDYIEWNFAPPYSPHFGGLYEAAVKSAKFHIRRIVGNASLTFEELNTVIKQVEAVLNSRPLTPMSNNPVDFQVLTPGHFLTGRPLVSIPEPYTIEENVHLIKRWKLMQHLVNHFWHRWSSEYIRDLQQKKNWTDAPQKISVGDIVIIKDDALPPLRWKTGRVTELKPGKDGIVRVVELKTQFTTTERAITQICPLYSESDLMLNGGSFKAGEDVEVITKSH